jgi:molybdopterin converting factor small subunit
VGASNLLYKKLMTGCRAGHELRLEKCKMMEANAPGHAELLLDHPLVGKRVVVLVPAGQSLRDALLGLDLTSIQPVIALVNGVVNDLNYTLQPGDKVRFLAQISGGSTNEHRGKNLFYRI